MAGIHLWRCSRCEHIGCVFIDGPTTLLCGDCFYRETVRKIMAAAFLADTEPTVSSSAHHQLERAG